MNATTRLVLKEREVAKIKESSSEFRFSGNRLAANESHPCAFAVQG